MMITMMMMRLALSLWRVASVALPSANDLAMATMKTQRKREREKEEADKVEEDEDEENLTNEISVAVLNISFCISCYSCNHWGWASGLVIVIVREI